MWDDTHSHPYQAGLLLATTPIGAVCSHGFCQPSAVLDRYLSLPLAKADLMIPCSRTDPYADVVGRGNTGRAHFSSTGDRS